MKKLVLAFISVLLMVGMMPVVKAKDKVQVYMFTKIGCGHCETGYNVFADLEKKHPDEFNFNAIVVFDESWQTLDEDARKLLSGVYEEFGDDPNMASTPTLVIGEFYTQGLPRDEEAIYKEIEKASKNPKKDKVKEIAKKLDIDLAKLLKNNVKKNPHYNNEKPVNGEPYNGENNAKKSDTAVVITILVFLIGCVTAFIIVGKSKK